MIFHAYNKSIADYVIFNNDGEFDRMVKTIGYYQIEKPLINYARYASTTDNGRCLINERQGEEDLVDIVAYCIMPTHVHLILKEIKKGGIAKFTGNAFNSYARYFNIKHNRKGPLWEGRSKKVLVKTDEQLMHLTRYIHLNPVTAYIVNKPEEWQYSSYREYASATPDTMKICKYDDLMNMGSAAYREFVEDNISHQRTLAKLKAITLE